MLLSSKNEESDGIKTFGLLFLYYASQLHLQTYKNVCVLVYIVEKVWLFEMRVPFL